MKNARYSVSVLRSISAEEADSRRQPRTTGAFAKTGKPGQSVRGDTSTRNALARILGDGESLLLKALRGLSTETIEINGKTMPKPVLPSNWGGSSLVHTVDGGQDWNGWRSCPPEVFENAARRGGWMKAMGELIAEHPGFFRRACKALAKNPCRGMNSRMTNAGPLTCFLMGDSLERWKTPGRAFRAISHGIRRAKEILVGFNIASVPWAVVMEELAATRGPQRGHKLGQRLALKTLARFTQLDVTRRVTEFGRFKGFRHDAWRAVTPEVREFYCMKMREGVSYDQVVVPPTRVDDGVVMFVTSVVTVRQHQVVEGYATRISTDRRGRRSSDGLQKQTLIVSETTVRSFHLPWLPSEVIGPVVVHSHSYQLWGAGGSYNPHRGEMVVPIGHEASGKTLTGSPQLWRRFAVRFAQKAWQVQDATLKAEGLACPTECSVLVFIQDSLSAGNCEAGTQAFAQANGWGGRKFVPAQWLLEKESRARAAAKVALARHWAGDQQIAA